MFGDFLFVYRRRSGEVALFLYLQIKCASFEFRLIDTFSFFVERTEGNSEVCSGFFFSFDCGSKFLECLVNLDFFSDTGLFLQGSKVSKLPRRVIFILVKFTKKDIWQKLRTDDRRVRNGRDETNCIFQFANISRP